MHKAHLKYRKTKLLNLGNPLDSPINNKYDFFIIIPAYNEKRYLFQTLSSIDHQVNCYKLLVIVVINNSNRDHRTVKKNNQETNDLLSKMKYSFELIVIDCFSKNFEIDSDIAGVGLARKIGMDYCLEYSNPSSLLCCLDADTIISPNYLKIINDYFLLNKSSAALVGFKHQNSEDLKLNDAIKSYEYILKYNAKKIKQAGSPYGYVSMGSTMVCTVNAYVIVGGMSIKQATEDFYFLQRLAKYTKINLIPDILVHPSARAEQRVYLGTGFRMKNFKSDITFNNLQISQQAVEVLSRIYQIFDEYIESPIEEIENVLRQENIKLWNFFNKNNFISIFVKIKQNSKTKNQLIKQFNKWFDNLKIHQLCKEFR